MASWPNPSTVGYRDGKKCFIPLENNPETLAALAGLLDIQNISFHDVLSLTDPTIFPVPRPVHAFIFIAPPKVYHAVRETDTHKFGVKSTGQPPFPLSGPDSPVMWFPQTIGNACGLMALIHSMANGRGRHHVGDSSPLKAIFAKAEDLDPDARAELLYNSSELEVAHMAAAAGGDTRPPPDPTVEAKMHFIAFAKGKDGRLWELEGGWSGPIERGQLTEGEDLLCEKAIGMSLQKYIDKGLELGEQEFSCVAVVESAAPQG